MKREARQRRQGSYCRWNRRVIQLVVFEAEVREGRKGSYFSRDGTLQVFGVPDVWGGVWVSSDRAGWAGREEETLTLTKTGSPLALRQP